MRRLVAADVSVRRGRRVVLQGVGLDLQASELVAVVGPNGAGKSTLLRCLAGLTAPTSGQVAIDGLDLQDWKPRALAKVRAYMPQNPRVEWPISVERLVAVGLTPILPAFGGLSNAMQAKVVRSLCEVDLQALAEQPATTLSGGELARSMLARALVSDPDLLVVDEPVASLDARHALDVMARLRKVASPGRLVVMACHDLTLAARYADRIVALKEGRLVADGPSGEVLTEALIEQVFAVNARITGTPAGPLVDFTSPA